MRAKESLHSHIHFSESYAPTSKCRLRSRCAIFHYHIYYFLFHCKYTVLNIIYRLFWYSTKPQGAVKGVRYSTLQFNSFLSIF